MAFAEIMKEHARDLKKLIHIDQTHALIEIDDKELLSHDGKIVYQQPKHEFKDLETIFQIHKESVDEIPVMSADISAVMTGFKKSKSVNVTFTGHMKPIHFEQGDFEAIMIPPIDKEEDEQTSIDGE